MKIWYLPVSFQTFALVLQAAMKEPYTEDQALFHFQIFDMYKDGISYISLSHNLYLDRISAADFYTMLQKTGEPMTPVLLMKSNLNLIVY